MYVTTEITIDFQRPRQNTMQVVQDDTTRKIRLILKNGGNDYDITSDLGSEETWVGAVAYLKPDGHGGVYDTTEGGDKAVQLVSGTTNQFDVLLVGQVFTAAGWTQLNIKFYNADFSKVLSTFAINVHVQRNAASDYESEDYSNMESLGAIRAEMVAFEATVRDELAALATNPEFEYVTVRDQTGGVTLDGGYIGEDPVLGLSETGDDDRPVRVMNVAAPTLGTDAANKDFVIANGISEAAKLALLNCFSHVAWVDEHGQDYYDELETALMARTLESITAVFAQGDNVILDTDSLDDLKSMLTVTAYYDDGTSAMVESYTLSGTLTAGTETITVSYGGKTTTFNVTVKHNYADTNLANWRLSGASGHYSDGVIAFACRNQTELNNYACWVADISKTLWSAVVGKTIKARLKVRADNYGESAAQNQLIMGVGCYKNSSITSLGASTNKRVGLVDNCAPTSEESWIEGTFVCDLNNFNIGSLTPNANSTFGIFAYNVSLKTAYVLDAQVYEVDAE